MSQKKNRQRRQQEKASATPSTREVAEAVFQDLLSLIHEIPPPPEVPPGEWTRQHMKGFLSPAIAWGWLMRVARSGAAAISLEQNGFGGESAPLTRSALEHAIRLLWAQEHGADFIEVALLQRESGLQKILRAQDVGWKFDADVADALEKCAAETGDDYRGLSSLAHLRAIVDLNPEQRGPLYMGWLLDTQECHPSFASAQPYYEVQGDTIELRSTSKFQSTAAVKACFALVAGLQAYGGISNTAEIIEPRLQLAVRKLHDAYLNPTSRGKS